MERVVYYIFLIAHRYSPPNLPREEQDVSEGRKEGRGCTNACVTERLHSLLAGLVRPCCLHILRSRYGILLKSHIEIEEYGGDLEAITTIFRPYRAYGGIIWFRI